MDFGGVAFDGLVMSCSDNHSNINAFFPSTSTSASNSFSLVTNSNSDPDSKPKWYGSGNGGQVFKHERSATGEEEFWRDSKMAKASENAAFLRSNSTFLSHSDGQHMLSFSSSPASNASTMAYYPGQNPTAAYARNTGYSSNMHGVMTKGGPFTPSQWMELEHQALIYKYLTANAPIPSNLILPIRRALESAAYSSFPGSHFRNNPYRWGAFQLGFSGSSDPEPGRCRRTDGKKWRCAKDAVVDQKYCERHMNRGRHRSRKPVEVQTVQSAASPAGGPSSATAKLMPMSSSPSAATVIAGNVSNNSLSHLQNHLCSGMQNGAPNLLGAASSQLDRGFLCKSNLSTKVHENQYSIQKQSQEMSRSEFGLVCSNSLLNPLHKNNTSLINSHNYSSSSSKNLHETKSQNSLRQFMDDWPHSDQTQLSISIPITTTSSLDFMSSTSSPTNDKLALSPLRLSRELDPTQMGLGMGPITNDMNHKEASWIPISWETSMGGPLGEVLHSTTNSSAGESKNNSSSPLNLMTDGWDNSPRMALSPTGVLQKTAFGSVSNSSSGSSPRNDNNIIGSSLMNSSSTPAAM